MVLDILKRLSVTLFILLISVNMAWAEASNSEISFWETARDSNDVEMLQAYLDSYPNGTFKILANILIGKKSSQNKDELMVAINTCDKLAAHSGDTSHEFPHAKFGVLEKKADEAIQACQLALQANDIRYEFQLGRAYLAKDDFVNSKKHYSIASDGGHIFAKYWMGEFYRTGDYGLKVQYDMALKYHLENVKLFVKSYLRVGQIYEHGKADIGVKQDLNRAFQYYKLAVENDVVDAYYYLAWQYEYGRGVEKSAEMAIKYYKLAIASNRNLNVSRTHLALLIIDTELSFSGRSWTYAYETAYENKKIAREVEQLLAKGRGNDFKRQENYIATMAKWVVEFALAKPRYNAYYDEAAPSEEFKNNADEQAEYYTEMLFKALELRHEEHPIDYPSQTPSHLASEREVFLELFRSYERTIVEWAAINEWYETGRDGCLDSRVDFEGSYKGGNQSYEGYLINNCGFSVLAEVELYVKIEGGRVFSESGRTFVGTDDEFIRVYYRTKRPVNGHLSYTYCPGRYGFGEGNSCGSRERRFYNDEDVEEARGKIVDKLKDILLG